MRKTMALAIIYVLGIKECRNIPFPKKIRIDSKILFGSKRFEDYNKREEENF